MRLKENGVTVAKDQVYSSLAGRFAGGRSASGGIASIVLLLAAGVGYRATADWFERIGSGDPLPVGTLAAVPMQLGDWYGKDMPLDSHVIRQTDTDDHVSRTYIRNGHEGVSLFAGCGVKLRDLMPHRPEVCYISAGWTLQKSETVELVVNSEMTLPCQIHRFSRSGLDSAHISVLNYYIVDGEFCPDVSLLRSRARGFGGGAKYVAQIQIAAQGSRIGSDGRDAVQQFAIESAPVFRAVLEKAVDQIHQQSGVSSSGE